MTSGGKFVMPKRVARPGPGPKGVPTKGGKRRDFPDLLLAYSYLLVVGQHKFSKQCISHESVGFGPTFLASHYIDCLAGI